MPVLKGFRTLLDAYVEKQGYARMVVYYVRLQMELINESLAKQLHQVDIANGLSELSTNVCLPASV